ncbi:cell envelope biogenesis protein OmpA [Notoacmeibacter marinus]|uniref:Cell envelope biogenesis protein OmpA n=1 Tax=Notoacmeibacter marinus TaxID=1876515 RepID=A0A231UXK1_9HYPH|nr:OmpA family protein [Notoacmeibacter marinus]OXT00683.1 cell envelope biogenesis protein OmpA [Notoacmeibacter marinus]
MKKFVIASTLGAFVLVGCTTDPFTGEQRISNTAGGAGIGAAGGALIGAIASAGDSGSDRRKAILLGAGLGTLAGGGVGLYMDRQEDKLRAQLRGTGVSVTRNGDEIILNMPSNITFAVDQSDIQPSFYSTLNSVALVLREFNRTLVDVYGHTDSTGGDSYNLDLSNRRADSVTRYLTAQGLDSRRFYSVGFGESQPIASNATESGRAQNRRVEIKLVPLQQG